MQHQDSSDPTGVDAPVRDDTDPGHSGYRARQRKANAAIQMRLGGASWNEIAIALGFPTARTALVSVEKALERELQTQGDRDAMRRLAGARLERLLRSIWPKAIDPAHPEHLIAATKAREVLGQHAKLFGLDAPTEVVVHNPTAAEIQRWVAQVTEAGQPKVEEFDILDAEVVEDSRALEA